MWSHFVTRPGSVMPFARALPPLGMWGNFMPGTFSLQGERVHVIMPPI